MAGASDENLGKHLKEIQVSVKMRRGKHIGLRVSSVLDKSKLGHPA